MPATVKTLSADDLSKDVEDLLDQMVTGDDSAWSAYAAQMAAEVSASFKLGLFKVWSSNNRLSLITQAHKRALQVHGMYAGVDQWRQRNRVVREGEKPFIIFGPPSFVIRNPTPAQQAAAAARGQVINQPAANQQNGANPQNGATPAAGQPAAPAPIRGYRRPPAIEVFDYTQTESTDPDFVEPDWSVPLAGGDLGTLARLVEVSPVPVRFVDMGSRIEHGWLDKTGITIDSSRTIADQIATLAHELGHQALGHLDQIESTRAGKAEQDAVRAACEQQAALVQFFTMKMLGLDESVGVEITVAAGAYLRSWTKVNAAGEEVAIEGHKGRRKLVKTHLEVAFKAAKDIVAAYAQPAAEQAA